MTHQVEDVWRAHAPHVLAALMRRFDDLQTCEDAAQEAFAAALVQWPRDGLPHNPRGWLIRVASRRVIDGWRSEQSRYAREHREAIASGADRAGEETDRTIEDADDTLRVLFLCAHPSLSRPAQLALTLRAVGGLSTRQIAAAFLVPEQTIAARISRAKRTLRESGARFEIIDETQLPVVQQVLYLIFNEGHTASEGDQLQSVSLANEAIRLTRLLIAARPHNNESQGLLALMLLTDARSPARGRGLDLIRLQDQDRARWDRRKIAEGTAILERTLPRGPVGPFGLQAAIAAVHAEAPSWPHTDWAQIGELYRMLSAVAPSATVTLNRAVALAMLEGPAAGLRLLGTLADDPAMARNHRLTAARAHLLEESGELTAAATHYRRAATLTHSIPEQRYLHSCADRCEGQP